MNEWPRLPKFQKKPCLGPLVIAFDSFLEMRHKLWKKSISLVITLAFTQITEENIYFVNNASFTDNPGLQTINNVWE